MKKLVAILVCVILLSMSVFAGTYLTSSFGLSLMKLNESMYYDGDYYSVTEKTSAMNIDFRSSFFGDNSTIGFSLGLSVLYPISSSADGVEIQTRFFNCNWCPQIGVAFLYSILDNLTMVGNTGYEMMFNYSTQYSYDLNTTVSSTLFVHGVYVNDTFIYKVSDKMNLNFGISMYFPVFGTQKISAVGYGTEKFRYGYSGLSFEPFIGFSVKR